MFKNVGVSRRTFFSALALAVLAAVVLGACASLDDFQRKVIFRPNKDTGRTPAEFQAQFDELWLTVSQSRGGPSKLHGWWIPSRNSPRNGPVALYLHGAGFGISANLPRIMKLRDEGFSVLAIDYRGFGLSDGELPSEQSANEDAQAAWAELLRRAPSQQKFIYGHSLGGAIAIELARTPTVAKSAAGLVVESSFTNVLEMQQYTAYKWIPLGAVQTQYFDSLAKAPKLCMPTLFMHGSNDYRVPVDVAKRLFDAAPEPKRWLLVQGARHVDIPTRYTAEWSAALAKFKALTAEPRSACAGS